MRQNDQDKERCDKDTERFDCYKCVFQNSFSCIKLNFKKYEIVVVIEEEKFLWVSHEEGTFH